MSIAIARSVFVPLAAVLVLSSCQQQKQGQANSNDVKDVASILADTVGSSSRPKLKAQQLPPNVVFTREDIPNEGGYLQISIGEITDTQANNFLRRLKSENCTCGCPHTIDQCLIEDPQCDTAHQLASQVLKEVTGGI